MKSCEYNLKNKKKTNKKIEQEAAATANTTKYKI